LVRTQNSGSRTPGSRFPAREIRKAVADVNAAEAEASNAELNYNRLEKLAQADATRSRPLIMPKQPLILLHAKLKAADEALNLVVAGPRKETSRQLRQSLDAYKAELALAEKQLADANLYAPATA